MSESEPRAELVERRVIWEGGVGGSGCTVVLRRARPGAVQAPGRVGGGAVPRPRERGAVSVPARGGWRHLGGPGGKLDRGEDPAVCAVRELEEETGYRAARVVETGTVLTTPGFTDERIHLFCAYDLTPGPARPEAHELIRTEVVGLERALVMIERGEIVDGKSIAALFLAARRGRPA
jgi:8-oxo-dGTP pyrophosphatase MutT (NUDIX family)